ncbi:retention module-containing protein [Enterovibrio sp. ZSDZ42]|uniref:Retention module-containing protein n=1 Tax=Enterovibrio gelatinilyticus TaxID=2899819 RepID=A0ABT5QYT9_9GAMM|nr:retention module-containing protein [Enterovibrio sp. ZSDZ42]MDD1793095.1 retention module-containing protein [Enterovibrio sp. ZSDZ42]
MAEKVRESRVIGSDGENVQLSVTGGQVYVIKNGVAIPTPVSETAGSGDIILAEPKASYVMMVNGEPVLVHEPCSTCTLINDRGVDVVGLIGNINVQQNTQAIALLEDEISALQQAILAGADPSQSFEEPAAGGALSSSIGGFAVIQYDYTSVLVEAGFATSYTPPSEILLQEDNPPNVPPVGGESIRLTIAEGDLTPVDSISGYPTTATSSVLIPASSLPLLADSFVIESDALSALVAELANDTTSNGKAISYRVSDDGKTIVGEVDGVAIVTIAVSAESSGRNVELTVTITLDGPLDHIAGNDSGLVTISGNTIDISVPVQGEDAAGRPLDEPITVNIAIEDGANPAVNPDNTTHNENFLDYVSEPIPLNVGTNSDLLASVSFISTPELVAQLESITSNGEGTNYTISASRISVTLDSDPTQVVFAIDLVALPSSADNISRYGYVLTQSASIDQLSASDSEVIPVSVIAVDRDGDTTTGQFTVSLNDGTNASGKAAVISGDFEVVEGNAGTEGQVASGSITLEAGSDKLIPSTMFIANLEDTDGVLGLLSELNLLSSNGEPINFAIQAGTEPNVIVLRGTQPDSTEPNGILDVVTFTLTADSEAGAGATGINVRSSLEVFQPLDETNQAVFSNTKWVKLVSSTNEQSELVESFEIQFELQMRDSDNDLLEAPIDVTYSVVDGQSPTIKVTDVDVTDPSFDAPANTVMGELGLETGSDRIQSVVWELPTAFFNSIASLTSNGNELTLQSEPSDINGTSNDIVVGYQNDNDEFVTVLAIAFTPNTEQYSVTLSQAIDQPDSETVALTLGARVTDSDGDSVVGTFKVTILDGNVPSLSPDNVSMTDPVIGELNQSQQVSLGLTQGSDAVKSIALFAPPGLEALLESLTASGYQTAYSPSPFSGDIDTIRVYFDDPSLSSTSTPANDTDILIITLDVNAEGELTGNYTVEQRYAIDQGDGAIVLPIGVRVVDTDNDSVSGEFTVTLNDSDGVAGSADVLGTVEMTEPDLTPEGVEVGYPDESSVTVKLTATDDRLLPSDVQIDSLVVAKLISDLNAVLTSSGDSVVFTYDESTATLTGKANNELVMTISLTGVQNSDGFSVDVTTLLTLYKPLDHLPDDKANDFVEFSGDKIIFTVELQTNDTDGDTLHSLGSIEFVITDGESPSITEAPPLSVEESDINTNGSDENKNNAGTTPGGIGNDQDTATGTLVLDSGSDSIKDISLDISAFSSQNSNNSQDSSGNNIPLSSHGEPVVLSLASDSNGTKIYSGSAESRPVFTLTVFADGTYTFALLGALDHPRGEGNNSLAISFPFVVTDSDGDTAASNIMVSVLDDVPLSLETDGVGVGGAELVTTEGDASRKVAVIPLRNRGADGATVETVTVNGEQHELTPGVKNFFTVTQGVGGQVLGTLEVQSNGNMRFSAAEDVDHSGAENNRITETFTYEIVDGDGDVVIGSTEITVLDGSPQLVVNNAAGIEDQGRQGDPDDDVVANPADGIPIEMSIDIGDSDQGEGVSRVVVKLPANAHGSFYANGTILAVTGNQIVLPSNVFVPDTNSQIWTLNGVTFVPDQDYSASSGVPTFTATGYVENTDGTERQLASQTFTITVEGIADVPQWDESTVLYYAIEEDSDGAALSLNAELQDTDGSETLRYFLSFESGQGSLVLNGETLSANNGQYEVSSADINDVVVKPNVNFSGDITLTVTAQSVETANFVNAKQTAESVSQTVTIAVSPVADSTTLKITRVSGEEDELINLSSHISLTSTVDLDGSEALFVRISGLPIGAKLLLADDTEVDDQEGVYEIAYNDIGGLRLLPPPQSNVDFSLSVTGVVKDTAIVTNAQGVTQTEIELFETGAKTLPIALKGVADVPVISADLGDIWHPIIENGVDTGIETTIEEDSSVALSFTLASGEDGTSLPGDNSETLTSLVTNIPEGVTLLDTNNNAINLVYAGVDDNGQPQYQAKVDGLSDIKLVPPKGSTDDITLTVTVVVTEDDGDSRAVDKDVIVHIEPKIDAVNYTLDSQGTEDTNIVVNWRPEVDQGFTDNNEAITGITFNIASEALTAGYTLTIAGDTSPLTFSGGSAVLNTSQIAALLSGADLFLKAPENVDEDENLNLSVTLTVEQSDSDSSATDSATITGTLDVRIVAAVEDDGKVTLLDGNEPVVQPITDNGSGTISLASDDHRLAFVTPEGINTDGTSAEVITQVVISFVQDANGTPFTAADQAYFDQFYIQGGINNGDGSWTIPKSDLDNLAISTTKPITSPVFISVTALVQDQGDAGENDVSRQVEQSPIVIEMDFTGSVASAQEAGVISVTDQPITGIEDTQINLGTQLESLIQVAPANAGSDELTLVISSAALSGAGATVSGMEFNYETSEYVANVDVAADGTVDLSGIALNLPKHFAGDFVLPVKLVTTDKVSGDTQETDASLSVLVTPVVDGITTSVDVIETNGLNSDKQPVSESAEWVPVENQALEDGIIELDFSTQLVDTDTDPTKGVETISNVVLKVDTDVGFFVNADGTNPQSSITVSRDDLGSIHFKPVEDFSGQVTVTMDTTVIDTVENDDTGGADSTATDTITTQVSFKVLPVNDPVTFDGVSEPISGTEDENIPLTGVIAELNDTDGSEQIVSAKLIGVPDDFKLISTGSQLVQNSGNGEWTVSVPAGSTSLDFDQIVFVPPKNFSGSMTVVLEVYAKEDELTIPKMHSTTVTVDVNPIGDGIDADITTSVSGSEDENILLPLDISVIDNAGTYDGTGLSVTENAPETIKVVLTNVPDSSTISLPSGVSTGSSVQKQPDGSWVVIADQTTLSSLTFTPGDANELNWNGQLEVSIRAVDNGVEAESGLWVNQVIDVSVSPVNDSPDLTVPASIQHAEEEIPVLIESIQVKDVDVNDASGSEITVRLSAENGTINLSLSSPIPSGVTITGAGSGSMTLKGDITAINQVLATHITYTGDTNFSGQDNITVTVNDNGNTGSGGALTDTESITVNVQPKPDIPTLILNTAQTASVAGSLSTIIPLLGLAAALTDPSETLAIEIRNIPSSLTFVDSEGSAIGIGPSGGVLTLTADELSQLHVIGGAASASNIDIVAISTTTLGESAESASLSVSINVVDPADGPITAQDNTLENLVISGNEAASLVGGNNSDTLIGGLGADILTGGAGDDTLWGGQKGEGNSGQDRFVWSSADFGSAGDPAIDTIEDFNPATNVIDLSAALSVSNIASISDLTQHLSLTESNGNAQLNVLVGGDVLQEIVLTGIGLDVLVNEASSGMSQTDLITAVLNRGNVHLGANVGTGDNDQLVAQSAGESLFGMDGNDTLQAGQGDDILTGGEGDDIFVWLEASLSAPANTDVVTDFTLGDDKLDISQLLPDLGTSPTSGDLLPYFDQASVGLDGSINLTVTSGDDTQHITMQNMDLSSTGLNLISGAQTSEVVSALYEQQVFKLD